MASSSWLDRRDVAPLVNPQFDPSGADLHTEDYFVLTRVDGRTSLRQLVQISGFPEKRALAILGKLRAAGAIYLPGETPAKPRPNPAATREPGAPAPPDEPLIDATAMLEECALTDEQKRAILRKHASLQKGTYFEILGVPRDADRREIKLAYFQLSKEFHPDRFFGRQLGSFHRRLAEIFQIATRAFEVLTDQRKRELYENRLASAEGTGPVRMPGTIPPGRTPAQPAADRTPRPVSNPRAQAAALFERACLHHVTGDLREALREFASVVALDPQPRYLRRAAEAALRAQELRSAEEYARKAAELDPKNASTHRTLAKVFRTTGQIDAARRELELARKLDPESPHIAAELDELGKPS